MLLREFDFPFDSTLIARYPIQPRDHARLLLVPRGGGPYSHHRVSDLPSLLNPGDVMVVNDTKVIPVRIPGRKRPGGGRVEIVLVKNLGADTWEALFRGRAKPGQVIEIDCDTTATVLRRGPLRTTVRLSSAQPIGDLLQRCGRMPLPPYIKREPIREDRTWYQTVFARVEGAIASPTASLHFTEGLLASLRARGIVLVTVTLHVGPGTFQPVRESRIENHRMEEEWIEVSAEAADAIKQAKVNGARVVAVGTTVVRTLEAASLTDSVVRPMRGRTELFIIPGYRFHAVDALMTNFHLPRTTLLMLVSALTGVERLRAVYREAIGARYRLYSYGDAMLII